MRYSHLDMANLRNHDKYVKHFSVNTELWESGERQRRAKAYEENLMARNQGKTNLADARRARKKAEAKAQENIS